MPDRASGGACIAAIYRPDEIKSLLGIPAARTAYCAISFGYPAADDKPAQLGGRKPVEAVAYWEKWEGKLSEE